MLCVTIARADQITNGASVSNAVGTLPIAHGGTGATTAGAALSGLGAAQNTTQVIAGTGMSGGGALSGNVTLNNAGVTSYAVAAGLGSPSLIPTVNAATGAVTISPTLGFSWDGTRKVTYLQQAGSHSTTWAGVGTTNTGTTVGSATGVTINGHNAVSYASGAVSGNIGGIVSGASISLELKPIMTYLWTPVTSSSVRYWVGHFSAAPDASDTPPVNSAGFRYSTVAGDTDFMCVSTDSGGTAQTQDSGIAFSANTTYLFQIDISDATNIKFYINGSLVKTNSTRVPSSTSALTTYIEAVTQTTAAATVDVSKYGWEMY